MVAAARARSIRLDARAGAPALEDPSLERPGEEPLTFATAKGVRHRARLTGMNPNYWYPVAWSHELRAGATREAVFWRHPIALFRAEDGTPGAVEDRCAHRHVPLTMGHVRGCELVCLYHGWSYGKDGALTSMRHDDFGKGLPSIRLRAYPVRERYGLVWIFPGHPELAERTPLPEIPDSEGPGRWASVHFDYTWKAHHTMVMDNICNLTHLYVHGRWVPYDRTRLARSGLEGERLALTWQHTLRRDVGWPAYKLFFRTAGSERDSVTEDLYDYPYHSALSNGRIRSCNFMLPIDRETTKVFTLQLWKEIELPGVPPALSRGFMQHVFARAVRPVTREIFRQDGATVEAEQERLVENFFRPSPELNPSVRLFDQLAVDRWQAWLDAVATGDPERGAAPSAAKVMV